MGIKGHSISPFVATLSVFIIGLAVITYSLLSGAWYIFASICFFPFLLIMAIQALKNPFVGVCLLFTFNYFFIPWYRYTQGSGLSVWYDVATVTLLVTLLIYSYHQQGKIAWKYAKNILTFGGCIWAIYTAAEILNPTALTEAWVYSRGTIYNTLVVSLISVLTMTSYKRLRVIMLLLSIFTLTAVAKAIYQKYAGFDEDFATVNPYLGSDGVKPFMDVCKEEKKGIFVLVNTSNPSSGEFQDRVIDGRPLYELVGEKVAQWGDELMGDGYSYVGAVVGATYPEMGKVLRKIMPKTFILVPGYGAQGGKGADLVHFFNEDGLGAIVNSSRGIIAAYKQEKYKEFGAENYADASRAAVKDMIADISGALENR